MRLRPYQEKAIERLRDSLRAGHKRPALQLPTGGGKTVIASEIIGLARERGNKVIFTSPAISLIDQTVNAFWRSGIRDVGVIQQNHPMTDYSRPVQVASVDTLRNRARPECGLCIVDEAHMQRDYIYNWMADEPNMTFVALSATPWARGMGAAGRWDDLIVAETIEGLTDQGYLVPITYLRPDMPDMSAIPVVRTQYGDDFQTGATAGMMRKKELLSNTVDRWIADGEGRPTIAFCVDRAHARDVQQRFIECGFPWEYIDAHTPAEERAAIGRRLERGEIFGVSSVGCLIVGLDWTFVSCVLMARPTKSFMLFIQAIGRGLRLHEGKTDCKVIDVAGNVLRLGHPYRIGFERLCDGTPKERERRKADEEKITKAHICPSCGAAHAKFVRKCVFCGYEAAEISKPTDVVEGDAELIEVGPDGIPRKNGKKLKPAAWPREQKQQWYGSFLAIRNKRGYAKGWAAVQYKEKFGDWPNKDGIAETPLAEPDPMAVSYIRSRMIRWAKSRKKE